MTSRSVEQRLRRFLLAVTASIFIGSIFELILIGHTEETLQWIPFVLSAVGLFAVAAVWFSPKRKTLLFLRLMMVIAILVSFVGMYLHFESNWAFTREINPSYTISESIWPALTGAHPLLAPGILLLAGVLGLGAAWKHPNIEN